MRRTIHHDGIAPDIQLPNRGQEWPKCKSCHKSVIKGTRLAVNASSWPTVSHNTMNCEKDDDWWWIIWYFLMLDPSSRAGRAWTLLDVGYSSLCAGGTASICQSYSPRQIHRARFTAPDSSRQILPSKLKKTLLYKSEMVCLPRVLQSAPDSFYTNPSSR